MLFFGRVLADGYGFSTLNYFHAGAQDYNWSFGQWALTESLHQPLTPKEMACDAVRGRPRPSIAVGCVSDGLCLYVCL